MSRHTNKPIRPPAYVDKFLEWFLPEHLLEDVQGDLQEVFYKQVTQAGKVKADKAYLFAALHYVRPYFFKRRKKHTYQTKMLYTDMIRSYITIALRNLSKHKSFSFINIAGLTIGITGALVIFLIVQFELSYDNFHTKGDRIYRLLSGKPGEVDDTGTPPGLRYILENEFAEVEKAAVAFKLNPDGVQLEIDNQLTREPYTCFVTPSFFEMFTFKWIEGNPQASLSEPGQVVIDEEMARKYFGGNALGKQIRLNNEFDLVVSGVIHTMPKNTDFPIQIAVSHGTLEKSEGFGSAYQNNTSSTYHTFVLLKKNADAAAMEKKFPAMVARHLSEEVAQKYLAHALQPLSTIHFDEKLGRNNFSKRATSTTNITGLVLIGIFLLLTACINFINLATAQATKRAKEVGIRKVLGSSQGQLIGQFLGETMLLTLVSVMLSLLFTRQAVLFLNSYLGIPLDFMMVFNPLAILFIIAIAIAVSIVAGFYPSLVLSAFQPVKTLKNAFNSSQSGGSGLRKSLVVFQFSIAQLMIICTIVVVSQMNHFNTTSLGFDKEAVVTVAIPESNPQTLETLRNRLSQFASIRAISFSLNPPAAISNKWWDDFKHASAPDEWKTSEQKFIDEYYLPMYNIQLLAGRNISKSDTTQILVNETLMREIGITDPQAALGERITYRGQQVSIVGVVKDFHNLSLHKEIRPVLLWRNPSQFQKVSFKINMPQAQEAISQIERHWKEAFPDHYFSYKFLDEDLATWYEKEAKTARLLSVFAFVAIFIGCLGLYGLVSFSTAQKIKEVGIRKVLGASVTDIVYLFTKEFVRLVIIAFLVAAPIGYYLMGQWLQDFSFGIKLSWWMFGLGALLTSGIALFTISFQSIKAALANPVKSLRNE